MHLYKPTLRSNLRYKSDRGGIICKIMREEGHRQNLDVEMAGRGRELFDGY